MWLWMNTVIAHLLVHPLNTTRYIFIITMPPTLRKMTFAWQSPATGTNPSSLRAGVSSFAITLQDVLALAAVSWSPPTKIGCTDAFATVTITIVPGTMVSWVYSSMGTYWCRCDKISTISLDLFSFLGRIPKGTFTKQRSCLKLIYHQIKHMPNTSRGIQCSLH